MFKKLKMKLKDKTSKSLFALYFGLVAASLFLVTAFAWFTGAFTQQGITMHTGVLEVDASVYCYQAGSLIKFDNSSSGDRALVATIENTSDDLFIIVEKTDESIDVDYRINFTIEKAPSYVLSETQLTQENEYINSYWFKVDNINTQVNDPNVTSSATYPATLSENELKLNKFADYALTHGGVTNSDTSHPLGTLNAYTKTGNLSEQDVDFYAFTYGLNTPATVLANRKFTIRIDISYAQEGGLTPAQQSETTTINCSTLGAFKEAIKNYFPGQTINVTGNMTYNDGDIIFKSPVNLKITNATLTISGCNIMWDYPYADSAFIDTSAAGCLKVTKSGRSGGNLEINTPLGSFEFIGKGAATATGDIYTQGNIIVRTDYDDDDADTGDAGTTNVFQGGFYITKANLYKLNDSSAPYSPEQFQTVYFRDNTKIEVGNNTRVGEILPYTNSETGASAPEFVKVINYGIIDVLNFGSMNFHTTYSAKPQIYVHNYYTIGTSSNNYKLYLPYWSTPFKFNATLNIYSGNTYIYKEFEASDFGVYISDEAPSGHFTDNDIVCESLSQYIVEDRSDGKIKLSVFYTNHGGNIYTLRQIFEEHYFNDNHSTVQNAADLDAFVATVDEMTITATSTNPFTTADLAFIRSFTNLTTLDLSKAVFTSNTVSGAAFKDMSKLTNLEIPYDTVKVCNQFIYGTDVHVINLPETCVTIENGAFSTGRTNNAKYGYENRNTFVRITNNAQRIGIWYDANTYYLVPNHLLRSYHDNISGEGNKYHVCADGIIAENYRCVYSNDGSYHDLHMFCGDPDSISSEWVVDSIVVNTSGSESITIRKIFDYAFVKVTTYTGMVFSSLTFGDDVYSIGYRAFYSVDVSSFIDFGNVVRIEELAFQASTFAEARSTNSITFLGKWCFEGTSGYSTFAAVNCTEIGMAPWYNCPTVERIDVNSLHNHFYDGNKTDYVAYNCALLAEMTIGFPYEGYYKKDAYSKTSFFCGACPNMTYVYITGDASYYVTHPEANTYYLTYYYITNNYSVYSFIDRDLFNYINANYNSYYTDERRYQKVCLCDKPVTDIRKEGTFYKTATSTVNIGQFLYYETENNTAKLLAYPIYSINQTDFTVASSADNNRLTITALSGCFTMMDITITGTFNIPSCITSIDRMSGLGIDQDIRHYSFQNFQANGLTTLPPHFLESVYVSNELSLRGVQSVDVSTDYNNCASFLSGHNTSKGNYRFEAKYVYLNNLKTLTLSSASACYNMKIKYLYLDSLETVTTGSTNTTLDFFFYDSEVEFVNIASLKTLDARSFFSDGSFELICPNMNFANLETINRRSFCNWYGSAKATFGNLTFPKLETVNGELFSNLSSSGELIFGNVSVSTLETLDYDTFYNLYNAGNNKLTVGDISFTDLKTTNRYFIIHDWSNGYMNITGSISLPALEDINYYSFRGYPGSYLTLPSFTLDSLHSINKECFWYINAQDITLGTSTSTGSIITVQSFSQCTINNLNFGSMEIIDATVVDNTCTITGTLSCPGLKEIRKQSFYGTAANIRELGAMTFNELTTVSANCFYYCNFTNASMPELTTVSANCFYYSNFTSVSMPKLTTVTGNMLFGDSTHYVSLGDVTLSTGLTDATGSIISKDIMYYCTVGDVTFGNMETFDANMFTAKRTTVNGYLLFPGLKYIKKQCFTGVSTSNMYTLPAMSFDSLQSVTAEACFRYINGGHDISFPALTSSTVGFIDASYLGNLSFAALTSISSWFCCNGHYGNIDLPVLTNVTYSIIYYDGTYGTSFDLYIGNLNIATGLTSAPDSALNGSVLSGALVSVNNVNFGAIEKFNKGIFKNKGLTVRGTLSFPHLKEINANCFNPDIGGCTSSKMKLPDLYFPELERITAHYAFRNLDCDNITFDKLTSIDYDDFNYIKFQNATFSALTSINYYFMVSIVGGNVYMPKLEQVNWQCFYSDGADGYTTTFGTVSMSTGLTSPAGSKTSASMFYDCTVDTINFGLMETIKSTVIQSSCNLTGSVSCPGLKSIEGAFLRGSASNIFNLGDMTFPELTNVSTACLYYCNFTSVSFPKLATVTASMLYGDASHIVSLGDVSFSDNLVDATGSKIASSIMYWCTVNDVNFGNMESIMGSVLYNCTVNDVNFGNMESIMGSVLYNCTVNDVDFENVKTISAYILYNCTVHNVDFASVETISSTVIDSTATITGAITCPGLKTINGAFLVGSATHMHNLGTMTFPELTTVNVSCLYYCNFTGVSFPKLVTIKASMLYGDVDHCVSLGDVSFATNTGYVSAPGSVISARIMKNSIAHDINFGAIEKFDANLFYEKDIEVHGELTFTGLKVINKVCFTGKSLTDKYSLPDLSFPLLETINGVNNYGNFWYLDAGNVSCPSLQVASTGWYCFCKSEFEDMTFAALKTIKATNFCNDIVAKNIYLPVLENVLTDCFTTSYGGTTMSFVDVFIAGSTTTSGATISAQMFNQVTVHSIDFGNIEKFNANLFYQKNTTVTGSLTFTGLKEINGVCFVGKSYTDMYTLPDLSFPNLEVITGKNHDYGCFWYVNAGDINCPKLLEIQTYGFTLSKFKNMSFASLTSIKERFCCDVNAKDVSCPVLQSVTYSCFTPYYGQPTSFDNVYLGTGLTSAPGSTIAGPMFNDNVTVNSVDFGAFEKFNSNIFTGASVSVTTSITLDSLKEINAKCFAGSSWTKMLDIPDLEFDSLETVNAGECFRYVDGGDLSFPALTTIADGKGMIDYSYLGNLSFGSLTTTGYWFICNGHYGDVSLPKLTTMKYDILYQSLANFTLTLGNVDIATGYTSPIDGLTLSYSIFGGVVEVGSVNLGAFEKINVGIFNGTTLTLKAGATLSFPHVKEINATSFKGNGKTDLRKLPDLSFPLLEKINCGDCFYYADVGDLSCPSLQTIAKAAFNCSKFKDVTFAGLTSINAGGIILINVIAKNVSMPSIQYIKDRSLHNESGWTTSFDSVSFGDGSTAVPGATISGNIFYGGVTVGNVNFGSIEKITSSAFYSGCTVTGDMTFPRLKEINGSCFYGTATTPVVLSKDITFPELTNISASSFYFIETENLVFSKLTSITANCFYGSAASPSSFGDITFDALVTQNADILYYVNAEDVSFDVLTTFSKGILNNSTASSISLDAVTSITYGSCFTNTTLTGQSVFEMPELLTATNSIYWSLSGVDEIRFPKLTTCTYGVGRYSTAKLVYCPELTQYASSNGGSMTYGPNLEIIYMPKTTFYIGDSTKFASYVCPNLREIYIGIGISLKKIVGQDASQLIPSLQRLYLCGDISQLNGNSYTNGNVYSRLTSPSNGRYSDLTIYCPSSVYSQVYYYAPESYGYYVVNTGDHDPAELYNYTSGTITVSGVNRYYPEYRYFIDNEDSSKVNLAVCHIGSVDSTTFSVGGTVTIDNAVTNTQETKTINKILDRAYYCTSINSDKVTITDSVHGIGAYAFASTTSYPNTFDELEVNSYDDIGVKTFVGNNCINAITIGEHVTAIGADAFNGTNSATVTIENDSSFIPSTGAFAVGNSNNLIVPVVLQASYITAAGWNNIPQERIQTADPFVTVGDVDYFYRVLTPTTVRILYSRTSSTLTSATIPSTITVGDATYTVTEVDSMTLRGLGNITSLVLPDGLVNYFYDRRNEPETLESYSIVSTNANYATTDGMLFKTSGSTSSLVSYPKNKQDSDITISNCDNILYYAFQDNNNVRNLIISGSTNIYPFAFNNCPLSSLTVNGDATIDSYAFENCSISVLIINGDANIGSYALADCTSLSRVVVNGNCDIGSYAFSGCSNLATVDVCVTSGTNATIGIYAFNNCSSLTSVEIDGNSTIKSYAFNNCTSLGSVTLSGYAIIKSYAFANTKEYITITITSSTPALFDGYDIFGELFFYTIDVPDADIDAFKANVLVDQDIIAHMA